MPIVQIYLNSGRDIDKKRKLVAEVTKAICNSLKIPSNKVKHYLIRNGTGKLCSSWDTRRR